MDLYTERLEAEAADIYEWAAIERLPELIRSFRGQGAALDAFLCAHGFPGAEEDTPDRKAAFLKSCFKRAGIDLSRARDARKWLSGQKNFDRRTGFRISFALGLDIGQTDDFFRTVMLDRGFDCHTIEEAVYYYCILNHRDYSAAEKILAAAPKPGKEPIRFDENILYTRNIINFIQTCPDDDTLLAYFRENLPQFAFNHVKATEFIVSLWNRIAAEDGPASRERQFINSENPARKGGKNISVWDICLQILGLDPDDAAHIENDRTIRPILENKVFLHEFASRNFPNRQGIEKMLRGEPTEHDAIRKTLILFVFYDFWISAALSRRNSISYEAGENDGSRCLSEIDQYLMDAGFPEIYPGNPYDWIFLWACGKAAPLSAFRGYMQLLSAEFSERPEIRKS